MHKKLFFGLLSIGILLSGCSKIDSDQLDLEAMYATMALIEYDDKMVECYTRISVGEETGSSVNLVGEHRLTCNGSEMERKTSIDSDYIFYSAIVPRYKGQTYEFVFSRGVKALARGKVQYTDPIQLIEPIQNFEVHENQDFIIRWIPSTNSMDVFSAILSAESEFGSKTLTNESSRPESGRIVLKIPTFDQNNVKTNRFTLDLRRSRRSKIEGMKGHIDSVSQSIRLESHFGLTPKE